MAEHDEQPQAAEQAQTDASSDDADVQEALEQAKASVGEMQQTVDGAGEQESPQEDGAPATRIELLADVDLNVSIELGRTQMFVEDVLKLSDGSVVELDKLAGDPVDVFVNGRLVARGEVLVLNDNFCVRISEIVANLEEEAEVAAQQEQDQT